MAKDEFGMPVPHEDSPLPWKEHLGGIEAANESWVLEDGFLDDRDLFFAIHAANNIIEAREIVRRLAIWHDEASKPSGSLSFNLIRISEDAARLWAKMREDVGDD